MSSDDETFLERLEERLRDERGALPVLARAAAFLGDDLRVARVCYLESDTSAEGLVCVAEWWDENLDLPPLRRARSLLQFVPELTGSDTVRVADVRTDERTRDAAERFLSVSIASILAVPFAGDRGLVGVLAVYDAQPRQWSDREAARVAATMRHTASALAHARSDADLSDSEANLELAAELSELGLWRFDEESGRVRLSERCAAMLDLAPDGEVAYEEFIATLHPEDRQRVDGLFRRAIGEGEPFDVECRAHTSTAGMRWLAFAARAKNRYPTEGARLVGVCRDVTVRHTFDSLRRRQHQAFELAVGGGSLREVLDIVVAAGEEQTGARVGVFVQGSPEASVSRGLPAGRLAALCTRPGFVDDVERDTHWRGEVRLAREHGIRACWCFPVQSLDGEPGGTLAVYPREARGPSAREIELVAPLLEFTSVLLAHHGVSRRRDDAEARLRGSEGRFRHIVESATEYAIITLDAERRITSWNAGAELLLGYRQDEILGRTADVFFTEADREKGEADREMVMARQEGRASDERWHVRKDGSLFWGSGVMVTLDGVPGDAFLKIFRDRTAEREADQQRELLVRELNHRIKNALTLVQSLANQSLRDAETLEQGLEAFNARLFALSRAQDALVSEGPSGGDLREVISATMEPFVRGDRVLVSGPEVRIDSRTAVRLALALHELATNAAKHGALSLAGGRVEIRWETISREQDDWFRLAWRERGGPPVASPSRRGFGTKLLERGFGELNGVAELRYEPDGVRWTVELPVPADDISLQ